MRARRAPLCFLNYIALLYLDGFAGSKKNQSLGTSAIQALASGKVDAAKSGDGGAAAVKGSDGGGSAASSPGTGTG